MENRFYYTVKGIGNARTCATLLLLLPALFFSCKRESRPPAGILTKAEMVQVLAEVYTTEEKVNRMALSHDSAQKTFDWMQHKIFTQAGIGDSALRQSLAYYLDRPREMEEIYTILVDTLQLREQRSLQPGAQ